MFARRETYRVYRTHGGWLVETTRGWMYPGPYMDHEQAIAVALVAVRDAKPSQLRISNSPGEWRAEVQYPDEPSSSTISRPSSSFG